tara:strand:+ start:752 stop:1036 length:285 start_codon:yes stop_codon:yes gene_type:complete
MGATRPGGQPSLSVGDEVEAILGGEGRIIPRVILGLVPRTHFSGARAVEVSQPSGVRFDPGLEFVERWVLGTSPRMTEGEREHRAFVIPDAAKR